MGMSTFRLPFFVLALLSLERRRVVFAELEMDVADTLSFRFRNFNVLVDDKRQIYNVDGWSVTTIYYCV